MAPADGLNCDNILLNLTSGTWVVDKHNKSRDLFLNDILLNYRRRRGILQEPVRMKGFCGYKYLSKKPVNSTWKDVGSMCDAYGSKPCCSNQQGGVCVSTSEKFECKCKSLSKKPVNSTWKDVGSLCDACGGKPCCSNQQGGVCVSTSKKFECKCKSCIDMRFYKHAELSAWELDDPRCWWRNYSAIEACHVIEQSPFNDIYYVGDSFMRNMFMTTLMLLVGDPVRGAWPKKMTEEAKHLCMSCQMYKLPICRKIISDMNDVADPGSLCGGKSPSFNHKVLTYYSNDYKDEFINLVNTLAGKNGTLIMLGVGYHMSCLAKPVIDNFLNPALSAIGHYYTSNKLTGPRWPRIFFVLPMPTGLLKPPQHLDMQNDVKMRQLAIEITKYCKERDIPVFDFRALGKHVHSFDGTHYGLGVNLMKIQILINYLDSL
ncbi:uncharacterized protein LOC143464584 isoform X1 [Clavelina lepadiformis]|uniref:uncharacterized protein LOC143464584 isoform X1 n=1 Tax=Clavelina lepadiformis TaxID=159417 RepID=UPI0040418F2E